MTEWGPPEAPALVLWHGLARTGRDFDELAAGLAGEYRVICRDTIGRGLSSWSDDPVRDYCLDAYAAQALDMLDALGVQDAAWLGTSMGGLIGMRIASGPSAARLRCLIINDIGPELPQAAIDRILAYASVLPSFGTHAEAEVWLRRVYAPFGPAGDGYWQRMTDSSLRRQGDGRLTLHYDPAIVTQFSAHPDDFTSWDRWERIACPCHLIWGRQSDLLLAPIVARMRAGGPRPGLTGFDDCGHAPNLATADAISSVAAQLARLDPAACAIALRDAASHRG